MTRVCFCATMVKEGRDYMIKLLAAKNIQGYYADALLNWCTKKDVRTVYLDKLNYGEVDRYVEEQDSVLIILGFGFTKNQTSAFSEALARCDLDVPFASIYHFASWGDECELPLVSSYVDEVMSPVKLMRKNLGQNGDHEIISFTKNLQLLTEVVGAIDDYHSYSFESKGNQLSLTLNLLGTHLKGHISDHSDISSVDELLEQYEELVTSTYENMNDYISRKLDIAKVSTVGNYLVVFLYAEDYVNEIAHKFIEAYTAAGYANVIVLVGKHTKGDDMFHIRVSKGLDAALIAHKLNRGKGKEQAATVFLGDTREYMFNAVKKQLLSTL